MPVQKKDVSPKMKIVIDKKTENLLSFLQILLPTVGIDAFDFLVVAYSSAKMQNTLNRREKQDSTLTSDKGD